MIVAIDGPAGAGKGEISKMIAARMGFTRIDTGAMYRCIALKMLRNKIGLDQLEDIRNLLENTEVRLNNENGELHVYLDGEDVSKLIRTPEVSEFVSPASQNKDIRAKMVDLQRKMKDYASDIVMEGRDITTVVFPNAELKIYLTASSEERAKRRYKELTEGGTETTYEEVYNAIITRDKNDSERKDSPLRIADDAVVVDNTDLDLEGTFEVFKKLIVEKKGLN